MTNRIVVVGGLGFIGSEIVNKLCALNYNVFIIDNYFIGSKDRLSTLAQEKVSITKADIRDATALRDALASIQPDTIINMAALHYIPYCIEHPEETLDVNVGGTKNLIEALKALPKTPRFIMASSAAVYGAPTASPQAENTLQLPVDIYGESKKFCEEAILHELTDYIILRLFNTFGPNDPHPHLIPSILLQLRNKEVSLGNPDSARDYIYVKDVAQAFVKAVQHTETAKIFNVGSGVTRTVKDVCEVISSQLLTPPTFTFNYKPQLRAHDPAILHADITLITKELGWSPSVSFENGLTEMIKQQRV